MAFEHDGAAQEVVCFGTEKYGEAKGLSIVIDLPFGTRHIIVDLVRDSALLQRKAGPFDSKAAKEPAPWAPDEGSADVLPYLLVFNGAVVCYPEICRGDRLFMVFSD